MQKYKSSFSLSLRDEQEPHVAVSLPFLPWLTYMMIGGSRCVGGIYMGWAPQQALYRSPVTYSSQQHYVLRTLEL